MIEEIRYVIAVPDLQKSAAFYRDALGFTLREIGDPGWLFFMKDGFCIMAGECPEAMPPSDLGDHAYFAYIVVDDIDGYFRQVRVAGAEILKDVRSEPWGMREFAIRTGDGHRIMFGMKI
jgi:catechol 2,3-dioxygenase-like lactoylglutathione lyase family enzyme